MSLSLDNSDRILVVSPHPDDESIGCGGLLSLYRGHCDVLLATDGYREDLDNRDISDLRVREFEKATDYLGVNNRILLHIPEGKIKGSTLQFMKVDFKGYRYVCVPNRYESHKDHADLYKVVKQVLKKQGASAELLEYEVWTTIRHPNIKLDISAVAEEKKKAILLHESQIKDLDYVGMILGLNAYRGKGHGCEYAEDYYSEKKAAIKKKKDRRKRIKKIIKR